jgi:hypothetical protein
MSWSEIRASWDAMKVLVKSHWPRLPDETLRYINGDRAELGRALQCQYGFSVPDSELAICEFEAGVTWPSAVT